MLCPAKHDHGGEILLGYGSPHATRPSAVPPLDRAMRAHIDACPDCQLFLGQQARVSACLDLLETPPVSPFFDARLMQKIEKESASGIGVTGSPVSVRRWWKAAVPIAAAALIAISFVALRPDTAEKQPLTSIEAPRQAADTLVEVEQVERALDDLEMLRDLAPAAAASQRDI